MVAHEICQDRKVAALRGVFHVPPGRLAHFLFPSVIISTHMLPPCNVLISRLIHLYPFLNETALIGTKFTFKKYIK